MRHNAAAVADLPVHFDGENGRTEMIYYYEMYTEIKSHPIRAPGRLLGGGVREACEEKREKARGREWIDSGAAFSMRSLRGRRSVQRGGKSAAESVGAAAVSPPVTSSPSAFRDIYCSFTLRAYRTYVLQFYPAMYVGVKITREIKGSAVCFAKKFENVQTTIILLIEIFWKVILRKEK